jgi:hypothetical protein
MILRKKKSNMNQLHHHLDLGLREIGHPDNPKQVPRKFNWGILIKQLAIIFQDV